MLNHSISHQSLDNVVRCWNKTFTTRCIAIDSHVLFRLERVDVVDGVLFAGCNVYAAAVVGGEAGLLGADLAWVLDCGEDVCVA